MSIYSSNLSLTAPLHYTRLPYLEQMAVYIITSDEEQAKALEVAYDTDQEAANAGMSLNQAETSANAGLFLPCRPRRADRCTDFRSVFRGQNVGVSVKRGKAIDSPKPATPAKTATPAKEAYHTLGQRANLHTDSSFQKLIPNTNDHAITATMKAG